MIDIKISRKPVEYLKAIEYLEKRVKKVKENKARELIWILEHKSVYTSGKSANSNEILDKNLKIINTKRGGKITFHGPGQLIFYFVINLNNKKKDVRWFLNLVEKSIITTLGYYNIKSFSDKKNIGIWVTHKNKIKKVAAIGLRISKWVVYHGFSININVDLNNYRKIIPCGIKSKGITNLSIIKRQQYKNINRKLVENFKTNLKI
tara:strand:+ start:160 stop:777 length:618 start_codon:yes stop_codon:yes gene_type:complete